MLPLLLKVKLMTSAMAGWSAAASPVALPLDAVAATFDARAALPVEVNLYDENLLVSATVLIDHDGNSDPETTLRIRHLFRCRVTNRQRKIRRKVLAMLAHVAEMNEGKTIEIVSVHRATRGESRTSPHRDGRAIDFRIRGVNLRALRDHLWTAYQEVGIGWYPEGQFIHMDTRPTLHDTAWTFVHGKNRYDPHWARLARDQNAQRHARRPDS